MSFLEFPQWRTPRSTSGKRRRRVAEARTVLTSEILTLDERILFGGMPVISIGDATVPAEGGPGPFTQALFFVMLSETSPTDVTVNFATQEGTANSTASVSNGFQTDFSARSGVLTIPAGQTNASITVPISSDNHVEGNETFLVVLTNPMGAEFQGVLTTVATTGTIVDDESPNDPAIRVSNPTIVEGNSGTKNIQFVVSVFPTPTSQNAITFFFFTADGTAKDPKDFQSRNNHATIPAGQIADTLNVPIVGDRNSEPNESFFW